MSNLTVFQYETQEIRTIIIDNEPWFVAKDLCDVLGISNVSQTLTKLDDDEKGLFKMDTPGGKQDISIVSESGMYTLVLRSRKPEAKSFRKWVTQMIASLRQSSTFFDFAANNKQAPDNSGFIYLALATRTNWCKIGMSKQPYKRMSSLQTGSPLEITLIYRIFTFDMGALEKSLHEYYEAYSLRGEWFDLPNECIKEFPRVAESLNATIEQVSLLAEF